MTLKVPWMKFKTNFKNIQRTSKLLGNNFERTFKDFFKIKKRTAKELGKNFQ